MPELLKKILIGIALLLVAWLLVADDEDDQGGHGDAGMSTAARYATQVLFFPARFAS